MSGNIIERIRLFNSGRIPKISEIKYKKIRKDAFSFFRGTCHLFYEDLPSEALFNSSPTAWICGDLHLENFGTFKGDNRLVYFDVNDFDDAVLAPCTWDLARFITSLRIELSESEMTPSESGELCSLFLNTYAGELAEGHIRTVERATSSGLVRTLLYDLKRRKRANFLDKYTKRRKSLRRFRTDSDSLLLVSDHDRLQVMEIIERLGQKQNRTDFFRVLDVSRRIAGTSSLGLQRYAVLVEGKGSPDKNYILELKEAPVSSLQPYLRVSQPAWKSQAERVVSVQTSFRGMPPALLSTAEMGDKSYVMRELQPQQDRIDWSDCAGKFRRTAKVITAMAETVAWGQLRSSGRKGSAIADELIAFGRETAWRNEVMRYAEHYAAKVKSDFKEYAADYDRGDLV